MTEKLAPRGMRSARRFPRRSVAHHDGQGGDDERCGDDPEPCPPAEIEDVFRSASARGVPVVDDEGTVVGVIDSGDLLELSDGARSAIDIATTEVIAAAPRDTLQVALNRMVEEGVDHLPIVDRGVLVGICTRTDILPPASASRTRSGEASGGRRRRVTRVLLRGLGS